MNHTHVNQDNIKKILKYFHRIYKPIFLGDISIEIGYSLLITKDIINFMSDEGYVRRANSVELRELGADADSEVYVLTGKRNFIIAYE